MKRLFQRLITFLAPIAISAVSHAVTITVSVDGTTNVLGATDGVPLPAGSKVVIGAFLKDAATALTPAEIVSGFGDYNFLLNRFAKFGEINVGDNAGGAAGVFSFELTADSVVPSPFGGTIDIKGFDIYIWAINASSFPAQGNNYPALAQIGIFKFGAAFPNPTNEPFDSIVATALHDASGAGNTGTGANVVVGSFASGGYRLLGVGPTFVFSSSTYSVAENAGTTGSAISVRRIGRTEVQAGVTVSTVASVAVGAATAGSDYVSKSEVLTFNAGETEKTFEITIDDDIAFEGNETVDLALSAATGTEAALGNPSAAVLTINEDETSATAGTIAFSSATYTIFEEGGSVNVTLLRTVGTDGAVTASVSLTPGSATAGSDYTDFDPTPQVINFGSGLEMASVSIPVAADGVAEGVENFTINITGVTGGASVGTTSTAAISIIDPDAVKPTVKVTSPKPNQKLSGGSGANITVAGTASDNQGLAQVSVQLNGGAFVAAAGTTTWTASIVPQNGPNVLVVKSVDLRGTESAPVTIKFTYSANDRATFAGIYNGLFRAATSVSATNQTEGFVKITTTATGAFSGTITSSGQTQKLSGVFGNDGSARFGTTGAPTVTVNRKAPLVPITVALALDVAANSGQIVGTVTPTGGSALALIADKAAFNKKLNPANAFAGLYTVRFDALDTATQGLPTTAYPQGTGVASLKVDLGGLAKITATLADGTKFTASALIGKADINGASPLPLYAKLFKGLGSINVPLLFRVNANSDFDGASARWFRPDQSAARKPPLAYPAGWAAGIRTNVLGAKYIAPVKGSPVGAIPGILPTDTANVSLTGGNLAATVNETATISAASKVAFTSANAQKVTLSIKASAGSAAGTVVHPVDNKKKKIAGTVFQKTNQVVGFFLGTTESGDLQLAEAP